jgi:ATP-dependent RNA helicase DeaD
MPDASDPAAKEEEGLAGGFASFALDPRVLDAIARLGFTEPTPIQAATIPALLSGDDIIGRARTGSGKTAAFGLPLVEKVKAGPRGVKALVLAPTRELALQVTEAIRSYARGLPVRVVTIYGGAAYRPQLQALAHGVPVVVGTPGRVLDHMERGSLDLSGVEMLVLDEADEMLRMGFIDDVEKVIAATPETRQIALFSATMPHAIKKVADAHLRNPKEIQVESAALTTHHIEQRGVAVPQRFKLDALARILAAEDRDATLIFARTRAGCQETADALSQRGLSVDALHGDLSQQARERVLSQLRTGRIDILVATDVAARGIDVERITHVINYDLPDDHEGYVHRIGRTGRAGRAGVAISLVTPRETYRIRSLENALKEKIERFDVPTDAEIDARRRARLVEQIRKASAEGNSPAIAAVLEALSVDSDLETVALGALRLLADRAGIELATIVSDQPPSWARSPAVKRGPSENRGPARAEGVRGPARAEGVELFIPVGSARRTSSERSRTISASSRRRSDASRSSRTRPSAKSRTTSPLASSTGAAS